MNYCLRGHRFKRKRSRYDSGLAATLLERSCDDCGMTQHTATSAEVLAGYPESLHPFIDGLTWVAGPYPEAAPDANPHYFWTHP